MPEDLCTKGEPEGQKLKHQVLSLSLIRVVSMKNDRSTWTDSVSRKLNCVRGAQCLMHRKPWCYLPIFDGFLFGFFHIVPIGFSIFWSFSRFWQSLRYVKSSELVNWPEERSSRGETWTVDDSRAMGEKTLPNSPKGMETQWTRNLVFFLRSTVYSDFGMVKLLRFSMALPDRTCFRWEQWSAGWSSGRFEGTSVCLLHCGSCFFKYLSWMDS